MYNAFTNCFVHINVSFASRFLTCPKVLHKFREMLRKWNSDDICFVKCTGQSLFPGRMKKYTKKKNRSGWAYVEVYSGNER